MGFEETGRGRGRPNKRDAIEAFHCTPVGKTLKDMIIELHIGKNMSIGEVAEALSIPADNDKGEAEVTLGKSTVYNWMELFNIPAREHLPKKVITTIENTVQDKSKIKADGESKPPANYDPNNNGFKCSDQCPHYDICKYREYSEGKVCPISAQKRSDFIRPIKQIISERYQDVPHLNEHYNNLADLASVTWEILNRKLSYIQAEDVTQILNRPDPVTGELKQVKVSNLLNGEIQKDQGTLIKLLELLRVTPKTAEESREKDDLFSTMQKMVDDAKKQREKTQAHINEEEQKKKERKDIKSEDDFNQAMAEIAERAKEEQEGQEKDAENALSIDEMVDKSGREE